MRRGEEERKGLRCRPGELAIVTKCGVPERIGLIVKVIERRTDRGHDWLTEIQGGGVLGRDVTTGAVGRCKYLLMRDLSLTPLNEGDHRRQLCRPATAPAARAT